MSISPANPSPNQVVLITGAAKRLGREIALEFARQGWDIALHYGHSHAEARATQAEITALNRCCLIFQANLSIEADIQQLFTSVEKAFGPLACLVNSAASFEYDRPSSLESPFRTPFLLDAMKLNLAAPILLTQLLYLQQKKQVHNSVNAQRSVAPAAIQLLDQKLINPNPDYFSYTLSKYALQGAIQLLALDFAPQLRVVGLAPGITLPSGDQTPLGFSQAHQMTPLGRSSSAEDIGKAAVFLAGAKAITGTTLYVDGGQHLFPSARDIMFTTP